MTDLAQREKLGRRRGETGTSRKKNIDMRRLEPPYLVHQHGDPQKKTKKLAKRNTENGFQRNALNETQSTLDHYSNRGLHTYKGVGNSAGHAN